MTHPDLTPEQARCEHDFTEWFEIDSPSFAPGHRFRECRRCKARELDGMGIDPAERQVSDITDEELAEMEAEAARATAGPWIWGQFADSIRSDSGRGEHDAGLVARTVRTDHRVPDARFIASARSNVPRLIAALRASREQLALVRSERDTARSEAAREYDRAEDSRAEVERLEALLDDEGIDPNTC